MKYIFLILGLLFSHGVFSQGELIRTYNDKAYAKCLERADSILSADDKDSTAWQYKGLSLMQLHQFEQAVDAFDKALITNYQPYIAVHINKAKALSHINQKEALEMLDSLDRSGMSVFFPLQDPLFQPISDQPEFLRIKKNIRARAFPCEVDSNYLKMDFWCGEWDVYVGNNKVGENMITKQEGSCMILEQYTTDRDFVGQSVNFYDIDDKKWKQIWISSTGNISKYIEVESKPSGYIKYLAQPSAQYPSYLQMTFTLNDDGSVTQFIEQSSDGKEWSPSFNGKYIKKVNN